LIKLSSDSAKKVGVPISVCGEMAGDTMFTSLLVGIGIKTLSMSISRILKVKKFLTKLNSKEVSKICSEILEEHDNLLIKNKLKAYYDKVNSELD
jgi:phosphotransferase system enzyme I (PtsI)